MEKNGSDLSENIKLLNGLKDNIEKNQWMTWDCDTAITFNHPSKNVDRNLTFTTILLLGDIEVILDLLKQRWSKYK